MPKIFRRKLQGETKLKYILKKRRESRKFFLIWKMDVLKVELLLKDIIVTRISKVAEDYIIMGGGGYRFVT